MLRTMQFAALALAFGASQAVLAQETRTHQDWRAFFGEVASVPADSCAASTRAGRISLHLAATPFMDQTPEVYTVLSDTRWNIPSERKTFRIEFEDTGWTMRGWGHGSEVVVHWRDIGNFLAFMEDVASGELATLISPSGSTLAVFSLEGSRSATIDLEDCVKFRGVALAQEDFDVRNMENVDGVRDPF